MAENHLIIFVKNPIAGQVNTHIARTAGNEQTAPMYGYLRWLTAINEYEDDQLAAQ